MTYHSLIRILLISPALALAVSMGLSDSARADSCVAQGISSGPGDAILDGILEGQSDQELSQSCHDERCGAIDEMTCAFDAIWRRGRPNPMQFYNRAEFKRYFQHYINVVSNFGRVRNQRFPLYCSMLIHIAARDRDTPEKGSATTSYTIELAQRITKPNLNCIGAVMAAFPVNPDLRAVIGDYRQNCHSWQPPYCDRVVLPAPKPQ